MLHLIFQDLHVRTINEHSIWLDMRFNDFDEVSARYAAQTHRRCIKSHLPADGLPVGVPHDLNKLDIGG